MILRNKKTKKLEKVCRWNGSLESFSFATEVFGEELYKGRKNSLSTSDSKVTVEFGSFISESGVVTKDLKNYFERVVKGNRFTRWCSFQRCAMSLGAWKLKYLFLNPDNISIDLENIDYDALVLSWESSGDLMNARETLDYLAPNEKIAKNINLTLAKYDL